MNHMQQPSKPADTVDPNGVLEPLPDLEPEETAEMLRAVLRGTDDTFAIQKPNHEVVWCNHAPVRECGGEGESAVGRRCHEVLGRRRPCDQCVGVLARATGLVHTMEKYAPELDRWIIARAVPIHDREGRLKAVIEQFRDVTASRRAHEKLCQAESILSRSPAVAFSWRHEPGWPVSYVTPNVRELLGYEDAQFLDGTIIYSELIHPDDVGRVTREVNEAAEKATLDDFTHQPYRVIASDATVKWVEDHTHIIRDEQRRPLAFTGIVLDVTERMEAEQALRASESVYRSLVESSNMGICLIGPDLQVRSVNRQMRTWFSGVGRERRTRCYQAFNDPPADAACDHCPAVQTFRDGRVHEGLIKHRAIGYTEGRVFRVHSSPVCDRLGNTTAVVETVEDVTERLQMEAELGRIQKLESVATLAGGIAHDFNNLLTAIMGNISLAQMTTRTDRETTGLLSEIEKAAGRAQRLTKQLLTFSKGGEPIKKPLAIGDLVRETVEFVLHGSAIGCDFSISPDLPAVCGDAGQLDQVVSNLVINARQAMHDNGHLSVVLNRVLTGNKPNLPLPTGRYVVMTITDSGCGIPKDTLPRIFDPFFTTKDCGNGLGLAVVHSVVRSHGGMVTVDSEVGEGTTFTVYLPASDHAVAKSTVRGAKRARGGHGRLLVLEDEQIVGRLYVGLLTALGYTVELATTGEEAVDLYRDAHVTAKPYNAVILDLTIRGGLGGKETLAALRDIDPEVKAVVASGYHDDPIMANHTQHGFAACLPKPFRISDLSETLSAVLKPAARRGC